FLKLFIQPDKRAKPIFRRFYTTQSEIFQLLRPPPPECKLSVNIRWVRLSARGCAHFLIFSCLLPFQNACFAL
ncbi:MAG: hypothetical protein LUD44_05215, partial [Firmicutes bacterium]|nr:hypothetical protein [Bacillota bacterium]